MSGIDFLLDTNVVIAFLAGQPNVVSFIRGRLAGGASLAVSQITRIELLCFPQITSHEERTIRRFLANVLVVGIIEAIENATIRVRRACRVRLPDAVIAATAIELGAALLTADSDLAGLTVPGLSVVDPSRP